MVLPSFYSPGFTVVGLDPSLTSFGMATLAAGPLPDITASSSVLKPGSVKPKMDPVLRLGWLRRSVDQYLTENDPSLVVLEGYSYGSSQAAHQLGELGGVLRTFMYRRWPYIVVPPSRLKKFVAGKGNAPKDVIRLELWKRFEVEAKTADEVDAISLAYFGAFWSGALAVSMLPKPNREAVAAQEPGEGYFSGDG